MIATEVHHIDGNVYNLDESNLEPLCHECHSRETAKGQAFHHILGADKKVQPEPTQTERAVPHEISHK